MRIHMLALGTRMPKWVEQGFVEYARRMPRECQLKLVELNVARGSNSEQRLAAEAEQLRSRLPKRAHVIAMDERGKAWRSTALAAQMQNWLNSGSDVALLVGSADGLHARSVAMAAQTWSLSPLTLPHGLVRVVVAEQLYRAWTILQGHPYHRE